MKLSYLDHKCQLIDWFAFLKYTQFVAAVVITSLRHSIDNTNVGT